MPTRMMVPETTEDEEAQQREWERDTLAEIEAQCRAQDPVYQDVRYHYFVSKSKGWRKNKFGARTKRRIRRHWKEVQLVSYRDGPFMSWHKFPFDEYATECLGEEVSWEDATQVFMDRIEKMDRDRRPEWRRRPWNY